MQHERHDHELTGLAANGVNGAQIEFRDEGSGQAVVFVHGAIGEECTAVLADPVWTTGYRVIHYHRRGYPRTRRSIEYTRAFLVVAQPLGRSQSEGATAGKEEHDNRNCKNAGLSASLWGRRLELQLPSRAAVHDHKTSRPLWTSSLNRCFGHDKRGKS